MKLVWARLAVNDRESIFDYIASDNAVAAIKLDELMQTKAALLTAHPQAGRPGRMSGTRELVVHQHYVLVYDWNDEQVRILRVLHTSLMWPPRRLRRRSRRIRPRE